MRPFDDSLYKTGCQIPIWQKWLNFDFLPTLTAQDWDKRSHGKLCFVFFATPSTVLRISVLKYFLQNDNHLLSTQAQCGIYWNLWPFFSWILILGIFIHLLKLWTTFHSKWICFSFKITKFFSKIYQVNFIWFQNGKIEWPWNSNYTTLFQGWESHPEFFFHLSPPLGWRMTPPLTWKIVVKRMHKVSSKNYLHAVR